MLSPLQTSVALIEVKLAGNSISGQLADSDGGQSSVLCTLAHRSLMALDVSRNALQGSVPACLLCSGKFAGMQLNL